MNKPVLDCKHISFSYHTLSGETKALKDISFSIFPGEFVSIVGPSGCGKSTLLSLISGLEKPQSGEISLHLEDKKSIGYMLQQDHLFDWRTIKDNVLLGPEINHTLTKEKENYALSLLEEYGLFQFINKKPSELSGGMRQRAALIRTMVMSPSLLLLDEPFSALDFQTRLSVSSDIGAIIKKSNITAILITHDLAEAISLSDRIIVLSKRPGEVKKEIKIKLTKTDETALSARSAPEFNDYFNLLWKEISDEYE